MYRLLHIVATLFSFTLLNSAQLDNFLFISKKELYPLFKEHISQDKNNIRCRTQQLPPYLTLKECTKLAEKKWHSWNKWRYVPLAVQQAYCQPKIKQYIDSIGSVIDEDDQTIYLSESASITQKIKRSFNPLDKRVQALSYKQIYITLHYLHFINNILSFLPPEIHSIIKEHIQIPFFLNFYLGKNIDSNMLYRKHNILHNIVKLHHKYLFLASHKKPNFLRIANLAAPQATEYLIEFTHPIKNIKIYNDDSYIQSEDQANLSCLRLYKTNDLLINQPVPFLSAQKQWNIEPLESIFRYNEHINHLFGTNSNNELLFYGQEQGSVAFSFNNLPIKYLIAFDDYFVIYKASKLDELSIFRFTNKSNLAYIEKKVSFKCPSVIDMIGCGNTLVTTHDTPKTTLNIWQFNSTFDHLHCLQHLVFKRTIKQLLPLEINHQKLLCVTLSNNKHFIMDPLHKYMLSFCFLFKKGFILKELTNFGIVFDVENRSFIYPFILPLADAWKQADFLDLTLIRLYELLNYSR